MDYAVAILDLLWAGLSGLLDYLSAHVLLCLVPAFFIAGALSALFDKEAITKYLGPNTPRWISYPIAAAAGLLIAVCSCTILPLFAGIWKKGAGLGPAVTFLFTGPAINILAITYTGSLIGWDIAAARGILAILFGMLIGLLMGLIFERADKRKGKIDAAAPSPSESKITEPIPAPTTAPDVTFFGRLAKRKVAVLFALLIGVLLAGTAPVGYFFGWDAWQSLLFFQLPAAIVVAGIAAYWALKTNTSDENKAWMRETWFFTKMILPLLLVGVFAAGIVGALIPEDLVAEYVGGNTLSANLIAVMFGVFMYFPTLVEVPIARMFLDLGMARGPLLAYLLADPELSLQSMLVIRQVMGSKKTLVYVGMVAVLCTVAGLIFGWMVG
ncbi:MAG: permease [Methanobacteriota archaeon]